MSEFMDIIILQLNMLGVSNIFLDLYVCIFTCRMCKCAHPNVFINPQNVQVCFGFD